MREKLKASMKVKRAKGLARRMERFRADNEDLQQVTDLVDIIQKQNEGIQGDERSTVEKST